MEVVSFCSSGFLDKTFEFFIKAYVIQTTLPPAAASASAVNTLTWILLFLVGALPNETDSSHVEVEKRFPFDELSGVAKPGTENMDADDMEDDDDDDDDSDDDEDNDSDDDDDDFSGEDGSDDEDGLEDDSDANSDSDDEDDDDDDDEDDDEDEDDEEDENNQPPSKKK